MQEQLQFIQDFANTIANTFKQFAQLCRVHLRKAQNNRPEFAELQAQLIEERKKRIQLQEKIRQKISGSAQNNDPLTVPEEQRKRPNNAFALFVADQRDKILKEHPALTFLKISALSAIKWKKMTEQQRMIYQHKFDEMSKLYEQHASMPKINKPLNSHEQSENLVKRQFAEDEQQNRPQEEQNQMVEHGTNNERVDQPLPQDVTQQQFAGTMTIQNDNEQQATLNMQVQNYPHKQIENMLNLFHTPVDQIQANDEQANEVNNPANIEQPKGQLQTKIQPVENKIIALESQSIEPSLQIIQQVVIDPTNQQTPQ